MSHSANRELSCMCKRLQPQSQKLASYSGYCHPGWTLGSPSSSSSSSSSESNGGLPALVAHAALDAHCLVLCSVFPVHTQTHTHMQSLSSILGRIQSHRAVVHTWQNHPSTGGMAAACRRRSYTRTHCDASCLPDFEGQSVLFSVLGC